MPHFPSASARSADADAPRAMALFASELVLSVACYQLATHLAEGFALPLVMMDAEAQLFLGVLTLSAQVGLGRRGLYARPRPRSKIELLSQIGSALGIAFLVAALLVYLRLAAPPPLLVVVLWAVFCGTAWFAWRLLYAAVIWSPSALHRVLFMGVDPVVRDIASRLKELGPSQSQCVPIGFLDDGLPAGHSLAGETVLGGFHQIAEIVTATRPDRIVVGAPDDYDRLPLRTLLHVRLAGVRVETAADFYEALFDRVAVRHLRPWHLLYHERLGLRPGSVALQSVYTNLIALVAVVVSLPLMLLLAAAIKLSSPGPVFERHPCVGFEGLPFTLLTFRCRQAAPEPDGSIGFRPTPLGRWLERLRLDRLPQWFNVLRGEISLIGPRPERLEYAQRLSQWLPYYRQRHSVKPGITGWAQINRRGGGQLPDAQAALEYDLYYIKHISPPLDAYILLHSVL